MLPTGLVQRLEQYINAHRQTEEPALEKAASVLGDAEAAAPRTAPEPLAAARRQRPKNNLPAAAEMASAPAEDECVKEEGLPCGRQAPAANADEKWRDTAPLPAATKLHQPAGGAPRGLDHYLAAQRGEETFSVRLLRLIDEAGLPDAQVYRTAGLDRRHFSKIRSNPLYQPKKHTALALGLALHLPRTQLEELLALAGYSLSPASTADLVVMFCLENRIYGLWEINEMMDYLGQRPLSGVG